MVCIIGPTASGKTLVSIKLAKKFNGEVISADSRQVYRDMDIGTAKIATEEMQGVSHHMLDILGPDEVFSVAEFKERTVKIASEILERGKLPFLVGGTMLYIDAVTKNYQIPEVEPDLDLRAELESKGRQKGLEPLLAKLEKLDPAALDLIDTNNPRRVSRALEYCLKTGKKFSAELKQGTKLFDELLIGLDWPREKLYECINQRVDKQLQDGLLEETKKLAQKYSWDLPSMSGIGYKQMGMYLRGEVSLKEAIEILKRDTRRYAKRQLAWWKGDERIYWVPTRVYDGLT